MNRRTNGRQGNDNSKTKSQEVLTIAEGIARLALAVVVVFLIMWLIVADPVLSANAQIGLKALMAFAFAALMSSMAGLIEIEGKHLGWVVRAAGGGAIFVVVWFTLPRIIGTLERQAVGQLNVGDLSEFDARSMRPPDGTGNEHGNAGIAVTVPVDLTASSSFSSSLPAAILSAQLEIKIDDLGARLPWQYFVRQVAYSNQGNWLSADPLVNAQAIEVSVGAATKREILFASTPGELDWKTFIGKLADGGSVHLSVTWSIKDLGGLRSLKQFCEVTGRTERLTVQSMLKRGALPSRIVFQCGK